MRPTIQAADVIRGMYVMKRGAPIVDGREFLDNVNGRHEFQ